MDKTTMVDFPPIAFQSLLTTNAILFGVFGFLYSVFATYPKVDASNGSASRPSIVNILRNVCRILAIFIILNAALTIYSLYLIYLAGALSNLSTLILGIGLGLIVFIMALFCVIWSLWFMN